MARPVLAAFARRLAPLVENRLAGLRGTVAVFPTDFSMGVLFRIGEGRFAVLPVPCTPPPPSSAAIRAPTAVLMSLARSNRQTGDDHTDERDGDARFFRRELAMEGDTGLVMALRYALEDVDQDPFDLLADSLPLPRALATRMTGDLARLLSVATSDAKRVQAALLHPLDDRVSRAERRLDALAERLNTVDGYVRRRTPRPSQTSGTLSHAAQT